MLRCFHGMIRKCSIRDLMPIIDYEYCCTKLRIYDHINNEAKRYADDEEKIPWMTIIPRSNGQVPTTNCNA